MKTKRTFFEKWMISQLRRLWVTWPQRNVAKTLARVARGKYKCAICEDLFGPKEIHLDHIDPVIDPEVGFVDWNTYIERLFVPHEALRVLCKSCHKEVTNLQRKARSKKTSK